MTSLVLVPATFRLVAYCLNQLRSRKPRMKTYNYIRYEKEKGVTKTLGIPHLDISELLSSDINKPAPSNTNFLMQKPNSFFLHMYANYSKPSLIRVLNNQG
jgi:hypothetical protein